ncbi:MAG TPA: enoyl-CoA hydratase-related protein [Solirubrobacterales bacterium]|nr:enoyl-CoA hydratase-related protein [Solirubrobacterales bacterium]
MASHETVDLTKEDSAARILLNRPEALNAWNEQFGRDLLDAVTTVAGDDSVRAVMITGAGRGFSSGADLKEQRSTTDDSVPDLSARLRDVYHPIITGLREMPKPVIAAVNGPAVGIGCSLALAADLIVAAESAYFLLAVVHIGLIPDGGSTAFIPARIGYARAAEMAMLGERVPADQALDWGLINRVVPDEELEGAGEALLQLLAQGPTTSYAGAKRLLNRRMYAGLAEQLEAEADAQREQGKTQDFIEGVLAFAEKRPPNFTGS